MRLEEVFEIWKKSAYSGLLCVHGGLAGGPGFLDFGECHHADHPKVRYGHDHCPANCPNFEILDDARLYQIFLCFYRYSPGYYNDKYNIDKTSKDYRMSAEEMEFQRALDADKCAVDLNNTLGPEFYSIEPEQPEDFT